VHFPVEASAAVQAFYCTTALLRNPLFSRLATHPSTVQPSSHSAAVQLLTVRLRTSPQ
jgi:hypothetical protein